MKTLALGRSSGRFGPWLWDVGEKMADTVHFRIEIGEAVAVKQFGAVADISR